MGEELRNLWRKKKKRAPGVGANEGATVGIMVGASEGSRVGALVGAELMHNPHIRGQTSSREVLVVHRLLCCGMQLGF